MKLSLLFAIALVATNAFAPLAEARPNRVTSTTIVASSGADGAAIAGSTSQGNVLRGSLSATGVLSTQASNVGVDASGNVWGTATADQVSGAASGALAAGTNRSGASSQVGTAGGSDAGIRVVRVHRN